MAVRTRPARQDDTQDPGLTRREACPVCDWECRDWTRMRKHFHMHLCKLMCTICQTQLQQPDKFYEHMTKKHHMSQDEASCLVEHLREQREELFYSIVRERGKEIGGYMLGEMRDKPFGIMFLRSGIMLHSNQQRNRMTVPYDAALHTTVIHEHMPTESMEEFVVIDAAPAATTATTAPAAVHDAAAGAAAAIVDAEQAMALHPPLLFLLHGEMEVPPAQHIMPAMFAPLHMPEVDMAAQFVDIAAAAVDDGFAAAAAEVLPGLGEWFGELDLDMAQDAMDLDLPFDPDLAILDDLADDDHE